jgi:cyclohexa-1,5-dienecarbonyl-CoA hydratase
MADEVQDPDAAAADLYAPRRQTDFKSVRFETTNGIARLTLDRPPANVLSVDAMREINTALESLEYQREVKLVVLAAAGKYFSPGFDLGDHLGDRAYVMLEEFHKIFENLAKTDKPSLAVVTGPALGAGSALVGACDIVYAAASAKFGHPEVKGGVFNPVAAALLPRLVGRKKAFEMLLGAQSMTAADAERFGLITRAIPDERLEAEVAALIQRFQDGSAVVLQSARRAISGGLDLPYSDAVRQAEDIYLNQLMASEDAEEGLKAVMAKRKPVWKDR